MDMGKPWFERDSFRACVIDWAYALDRQYPDSRIVAVGQSAAWIVQAASLLRQAQGRGPATEILPYSGRLLADTIGEPTCFRLIDAWPQARAISRYFNHLAGIGCHPRDIIRNAQAGQDTVFVDMMNKGTGFASFITLWLQEAARHDQLDDAMRAMRLHAYDLHDKFNGAPLATTDNRGGSYRIPVTYTDLNNIEYDVMRAISKSTDKTTGLGIRLAPQYALTGRKAGLVPVNDNDGVRQKITGMLAADIEQRQSAVSPSVASNGAPPVVKSVFTPPPTPRA